MNELMEPLVAALRGGPSLISQGLRTLELFVDNLQPEFLQEKIKPVRGSMMRALWDIINRDEIIRSSKEKEQCSAVAYRILGKFGGENRSSLREPAKLNWKRFNTPGCVLMLIDGEKKIELVMDQLIFDAFDVIKNCKNSKMSHEGAIDLLIVTLTSFLPKGDEEFNLENRIKFNLFHTKSDDSFRLQDSARILRGVFITN
jgi:transformation/transcription domain-associated protein